jgi:hypothetical protein
LGGVRHVLHQLRLHVQQGWFSMRDGSASGMVQRKGWFSIRDGSA